MITKLNFGTLTSIKTNSPSLNSETHLHSSSTDPTNLNSMNMLTNSLSRLNSLKRAITETMRRNFSTTCLHQVWVTQTILTNSETFIKMFWITIQMIAIFWSFWAMKSNLWSRIFWLLINGKFDKIDKEYNGNLDFMNFVKKCCLIDLKIL